VHSKIDEEYKKGMHNILDLCEEDYDPKKPVICFDEKLKQLLEDKRQVIPMKKGSPEKYDHEYKRNCKANIFVAVELVIKKP